MAKTHYYEQNFFPLKISSPNDENKNQINSKRKQKKNPENKGFQELKNRTFGVWFDLTKTRPLYTRKV